MTPFPTYIPDLPWHGIICVNCNRTVPVTEFYANRRAKSGHLSRCKPCQRRAVSVEEHRRRNRERQRRLRMRRVA